MRESDRNPRERDRVKRAAEHAQRDAETIVREVHKVGGRATAVVKEHEDHASLAADIEVPVRVMRERGE